MINISYEVFLFIIILSMFAGFVAAILFSEWLNSRLQKAYLKKQTVKPWATDKNGHANRRSEDRHDGVKSIHGYQPHTSKEAATPPGGE